MSRLDLVEASLLALDKKCSRRGDKIIGQCPAHQDSSPSFTAKIGADGGVLFHCFAGCLGAQIMDALGLRWDQIKAGNYRAARSRSKPVDPGYDECFQMIAESSMAQGKRLSASEQQQYRDCLRRLYAEKGVA